MYKSSLGKEKSKCLETVHCNEVLFVSTVQQIVLQRALFSKFSPSQFWCNSDQIPKTYHDGDV